jgi:hypothetical protein
VARSFSEDYENMGKAGQADARETTGDNYALDFNLQNNNMQHIGGSTTAMPMMEPTMQMAQAPKQIAHKPDAAYRQSQLPPSAPPNPYGNAGGGYADDEMARMVKISQALQNRPRGIMT